ncbi:MAG: L-lactate dehydrogenase [Candidatus Babeliales bacterium]
MPIYSCQKSECSSKVAIIGAGFVGSTTAYSLMLDGCVSEIALIDVNKEKAVGEALDLNHCMQFTRLTNIVAGNSFEMVSGASIVIICAGFGQATGESRTNLLQRNAKIFKEIIPQIIKYNQDCILLVVTNPLDVLTYLTLKISGFPSCRVFGTGTVLDTARLRYLIGSYFKISPKDISAYILGEHGDSEFIWLSKATIGGVAIDKFPEYSDGLIKDVCNQTQNAAYQIISRKGATYYSIALVITKIVRSILQDQSRVFPVSTLIENEIYGVKNICLSIPTVVRKGGVCQRLDIDLNEMEQKFLKTSANKIMEGINSIKELILVKKYLFFFIFTKKNDDTKIKK